MKNLLTALTNAKREFDPVLKDRANEFFSSKYATLGSVLKAIGAQLDDNGLTVVQTTEVNDRTGETALITTLHHIESGESLSSEWLLTPSKKDPQGMGSALSYGRRYALMTMFGLNAEDDDGNEATRPSPSKDWLKELNKTKTSADCRAVWAAADEAGDLTDALKKMITDRGAAFKEAEDKAQAELETSGRADGLAPTAPETEHMTNEQIAKSLDATETPA